MDVIYPFPTASQTVGPFYHIGLHWEGSNVLVDADAPGERITIRGQVLDGNGRPVPDALIEVWQADGEGRYASPEDPRSGRGGSAFSGFGRAIPDGEGRFEIVTLKPGTVPGPDGVLQAPHIAVNLFARGLLKHLVTRIYFADEAEANAKDPVLSLVPAERRQTLIAQLDDDRRGHYRWDIVLSRGRETVFFEC